MVLLVGLYTKVGVPAILGSLVPFAWASPTVPPKATASDVKSPSESVSNGLVGVCPPLAKLSSINQLDPPKQAVASGDRVVKMIRPFASTEWLTCFSP